MFHKEPTADSVQCIKIASEAKLAVFYQRCLLKLRKCSNHIWFIKQCLVNNVIPKHIKIKCNNKSNEANTAVQTAYKKWLQEEEHTWYRTRDNVSLHLKLIHTELLHQQNRDLMYTG